MATGLVIILHDSSYSPMNHLLRQVFPYTSCSLVFDDESIQLWRTVRTPFVTSNKPDPLDFSGKWWDDERDWTWKWFSYLCLELHDLDVKSLDPLFDTFDSSEQAQIVEFQLMPDTISKCPKKEGSLEGLKRCTQ